MEVNKHKAGESFTCNVCGLRENALKNICLKNVKLITQGGVTEYESTVPEHAGGYPEVYVYGRTLPASGIYFRYIDGLTLENVDLHTYLPDSRKQLIFEHVTNLKTETK